MRVSLFTLLAVFAAVVIVQVRPPLLRLARLRPLGRRPLRSRRLPLRPLPLISRAPTTPAPTTGITGAESLDGARCGRPPSGRPTLEEEETHRNESGWRQWVSKLCRTDLAPAALPSQTKDASVGEEVDPLRTLLTSGAWPDNLPRSAEMPDKAYLRRVDREAIGYPSTANSRFPEAREYMEFNLNNVGDPFSTPIRYKPNTHVQERAVIDFFSKDIWGFEDPTKLWGYVTASGTEGNLQGCYLGREVLAAKSGGEIQPVLYTSDEAHYSLVKIARLLNIRIKTIETDAHGFMDMQQFEKALRLNLGSPALIAATIGTTMKGAIDSPERLYQVLEHTGMQDNYHMHLDGALMGNVLPLLTRAQGSDVNGFDLRSQFKYAHSISVSGHKFMGVPFPCGVFLSWHRRHLEIISQDVQYIGGRDDTVMGSRSGHSVLYLLEEINREGVTGLAAMARSCLENAHYLLGRMEREFSDRQPFLNPDSITVVFNSPSDALVEKHQLATSTTASGVRIAHVVTVGHVSKAMIDDFLYDLKVEEATREYSSMKAVDTS